MVDVKEGSAKQKQKQLGSFRAWVTLWSGLWRRRNLPGLQTTWLRGLLGTRPSQDLQVCKKAASAVANWKQTRPSTPGSTHYWGRGWGGGSEAGVEAHCPCQWPSGSWGWGERDSPHPALSSGKFSFVNRETPTYTTQPTPLESGITSKEVTPAMGSEPLFGWKWEGSGSWQQCCACCGGSKTSWGTSSWVSCCVGGISAACLFDAPCAQWCSG